MHLFLGWAEMYCMRSGPAVVIGLVNETSLSNKSYSIKGFQTSVVQRHIQVHDFIRL